MSALRQPTPSNDKPAVTALPATPRAVLDTIREAYAFLDASNEAVALEILSMRPDIAAVLVEALPHVYEIFGAETRIVLLATDHYDGRPTTLSARIEAAGPVQEQAAKLDELYRTWWLGAGDSVLGDLTFGV
jgi:hypothetical protein